MNYLQKLIKEKGLHTDTESLVIVKSNNKTWYNLYTEFNGKDTFNGETIPFTDINKAIQHWITNFT